MPVIYFLRHGQTDWNADARLQGQLDIALNDTGRAQARRNGEALAKLIADPAELDYVASPLTRARATMRIVRAELGLPPEGYRTEPGLMEMHYGDWQGRSWAELMERDPQEYARRAADPWNWVAPGDGGESLAKVFERARAWLDRVPGDTVVVSHGGIKRCLRKAVENLSPEDALRLDVPQDKVMVIRAGTVELV